MTATQAMDAPTLGERRAGVAQGVLLVLMATLAVMGVLVIAPILPSLQAAYADVPGIGIIAPVIVTLPALCVALFSPLAGWLCDRFGRRRLLFIALAAYAPLGAAPFLLENIWAIVATRVGVGVAEAFIMTASTVLIGDYFQGKQRENWLALQVGVASVSAIAFLLLSGAIGAENFRASFLIYLSALGLLVLAIPVLFEPAVRHAEGEVARVAFPWGVMAPILAITVLAGILFYIVPIQMGFILGAQGVTSPAVIGQVAALGAVAVPVGTVIFRLLSKAKVGWLMSASFLLAGVGLLIIAQTRTVPPTMAGVIVNQLGCGVLLPCMLAWAMSSLPPEVRGRGVGFWTGAFFIGQFLSPVVFGATQAAAGGLGSALTILGAVGAVSGLAMLAFVFRPVGAASGHA